MAIATDCKSVLFGVRWFESTLSHREIKVGSFAFIETRGSSSFGRAIAFQAICGGFEPRLPLTETEIRASHNWLIRSYCCKGELCRCSSVVEYFLGKEGVTSSSLVNGSKVSLKVITK